MVSNAEEKQSILIIPEADMSFLSGIYFNILFHKKATHKELLFLPQNILHTMHSQHDIPTYKGE